MGFIQDMWKTICGFFLGVWDSFCTMLIGIVQFFGAVIDFFDSLFDNIIDLIADGLAALFVLMFGNPNKADPLAEQLSQQIQEAQRTNKIPKVSLEKLRVAAKVKDGKVVDYKAYEVNEDTGNKDMDEIEEVMKRECIVEIGT